MEKRGEEGVAEVRRRGEDVGAVLTVVVGVGVVVDERVVEVEEEEESGVLLGGVEREKEESFIFSAPFSSFSPFSLDRM